MTYFFTRYYVRGIYVRDIDTLGFMCEGRRILIRGVYVRGLYVGRTYLRRASRFLSVFKIASTMCLHVIYEIHVF